jgi:chorismate mutase
LLADVSRGRAFIKRLDHKLKPPEEPPQLPPRRAQSLTPTSPSTVTVKHNFEATRKAISEGLINCQNREFSMDTAIDINDPGKALDLANIRFQLIRLEDTVLFHIIERVQFPYNKTIYVPGAIEIPGSDLSFSEWVLREQEVMQSKIRRYQSPDEYPFFPDAMQTPILKELRYPKILWDNDVNVNAELKRRYVNDILPAACAKFGREERAEAQENYGSAATADVNCLQALSRRIHFGKFVAESKFKSDPEKFVALIKAHDTKGIDEAITNAAVEKQVLERLRLKANTYGQDPNFSGEGGEHKVDVDAVVAMYKDHVIPLTKIVEVDYLMQRLKGTQWE